MEAFMEKAKKIWLSDSFKKGILNKRLVLLGILGILFILSGSFFDSYNPATNNKINKTSVEQHLDATIPKSYEDILEAKLSNVLSQLKGAGSVVVSITLENSSIQEYAKNTTHDSKVVQEKDTAGGIRTTTEEKVSEQILVNRENGTERPVMVQEIKPAVKGVLVIAEGAYDSTVKANLTKAVEICLGIPSYKVTVLPERK